MRLPASLLGPALLPLLPLLTACTASAAAGTPGPTPTAPPPTSAPGPSPAVLAEVRAAVVDAGLGPAPFEVLLVDPSTAVATDDRTWAVAVRRETGTWQVAERASLR